MRRRAPLWAVLLAALAALWPRPAAESPPSVADWLPLRRDEVREGDTLESLVARLGLPAALTPRLAAACEGVADLRRLRPGDPFLLVRRSAGDTLRLAHYGPGGRCLELTLPLALRADSLVELGGDCRARVDSTTAAPRVVERAGRIEATLYDALVGAGGSPQTVLAYADIFQWDVDFLLDVRAGDGFWLAVEETRVPRRYLGDSVTVEGPILAARYTGGGRRIEACRHEGCGAEGYFDAAGRSFQKQFLSSPLNYRRVSSQFGMRHHPVLRRVRMHHGIDYSAPRGTPVVAAADGVVLRAGWERGYGKVVRLRHDRRHQTVYGHLSRIAPGLRPGRRVAQNELVGRVGATGLATGPHLHYEFVRDGRSVNPARALNQPGRPVPEACRDEFLAIFGRWFGGGEEVAGAPQVTDGERP